VVLKFCWERQSQITIAQIQFRYSLLQFCPGSFVPVSSKSRKITIYVTIILPDVLYQLETSYFTLWNEHRLRLFENRVLRIFGSKREKEVEALEDYLMRSFIICTLHKILSG